MYTRLKAIEDSSAATIEMIATEARDIAQISADYQQARGHRKNSLRATITKKLDELLSVMLTFGGQISREEASGLLAEHHPLTEQRLAKLDPAAIPLVVVRELASMHMTPIDRKNLQNWNLFSDRYRPTMV